MEPIHILGAGSIGLLWAAKIRMAFPSYPLRLLLTDRHEHRIDNGHCTICLSSPQGPPRIVHVPATTISKLNNNNNPMNNVVVTTKAFQAATAVDALSSRLSSQTRLYVLCNGAMAVEQELRTVVSPLPKIHLATTTHGAYRQESDDELFHVVHAGLGHTVIDSDPAMARLWDMAGLDCQSIDHEPMRRRLWYKLAANCAINPTTALHQCRNGAVREVDAATVDAVVDEVAVVAQTSVEGIDVDEMRDFVYQVIDDTADNISSMWQDVLAGRRTEIDYLNGYVVGQGRVLGLDCPVNERLWQQVRALEST